MRERNSLGLEGNVVRHKDSLGQIEGRPNWEGGREIDVAADLVLHIRSCQLGRAAARLHCVVSSGLHMGCCMESVHCCCNQMYPEPFITALYSSVYLWNMQAEVQRNVTAGVLPLLRVFVPMPSIPVFTASYGAGDGVGVGVAWPLFSNPLTTPEATCSTRASVS